MATTASIAPNPVNETELEQFADHLFDVAQSQLAKMTPEKREEVVASIHAIAEKIRERP
jgi:hypothetical protein